MKNVTAFLRRVILPSSVGGLILRSLIVVALVVVIAGPIAWNVSVDHARKRASDNIAQASAAIDKARPAASEGTWEGDQLAKAQTALLEANASYDSGSFFNRGSYERAKSHANDSLAFSTSVTGRVKESLAAAETLANQPEGYAQAIKAFFRFYKRYPRTTEAQDALNEAESALFERSKNLSTVGRLASIANFEIRYPLKNVPSRTAEKARSTLLEIARTQYRELKYLTSTTHPWVHDMLNKGRASTIYISLTSSSTHDVSTALKLVRALRQPPAMRQLLSLLKAGDLCGARIKNTYEHPSSETSSTKSFSTYQINSIGSLTDEIAANLSKEKKLLAKL